MMLVSKSINTLAIRPLSVMLLWGKDPDCLVATPMCGTSLTGKAFDSLNVVIYMLGFLFSSS